MAVIRNDDRALEATITRGGWVFNLSAIGVVLSLIGMVLSLAGALLRPTVSTVVVALISALVLIVVPLAVVYAWLQIMARRIRRTYRLVVSAQGIAWSAWRGQASAPWSAIRSFEYRLNGRILRVHTEPADLLHPRSLPWWHHQWRSFHTVWVRDMELDQRTVNDAITRFSAQAAQPH